MYALESDCWFGLAPQCCASCHPCVGEDFSASCPPDMFRGSWGPRQWGTAVCKMTPLELPGRAPPVASVACFGVSVAVGW